MKEKLLDFTQAVLYFSAAVMAWFDAAGSWPLLVICGLILSSFEDDHKILKAVEVGVAASSYYFFFNNANWAWVIPGLLGVWNIIDVLAALRNWFKNPQFFPAAEGG